MNRLKDVPKIRFNTSFDANQSCAIANVHIEGTNPEAVTKYLFDKHRIFTVPIMHEEFQGIRITPNVYTTLGELDRFCDQMELIARKGLHAYRIERAKRPRCDGTKLAIYRHNVLNLCIPEACMSIVAIRPPYLC